MHHASTMRLIWLLTCVLTFCSTFAMFESDALRTLGLRKGATPEEIKKAYKRLAREHHPDKGGDSDAFIKIHDAYESLQGGGSSAPPAGTPSEDALFAALFRFEQEFGDAFAAYGDHIAKAWSNATLLEQSLKQSVDRAWPTSPDDSYAVRIKRSLLKSSMSWLVWTLSKLDLEHIMKKVGDHIGQGNVRFTVNGRRVDPAEVRRRYTAYARRRREEL